jgi:tetratricopeptide (TPR) repeat protein
MGVILARQGKFEEAIDHFSRALEIQPDSSLARKYLDRVMEEVAKKGKKVYPTP